jgi:hypothetical protein
MARATSSAIVVLACSLLLAGCGGGSSEAQTTGDPGEVAFDLSAEGGSSASGVRARLRYLSEDRTRVIVDGLDEGESAGGGANPAWLRSGSCTDPGDVVQRLQALKGSTSTTTVPLGLTALLNGDYAIQVGVSGPETKIAECGDVPDDVEMTSTEG